MPVMGGCVSTNAEVWGAFRHSSKNCGCIVNAPGRGGNPFILSIWLQSSFAHLALFLRGEQESPCLCPIKRPRLRQPA